MPCSTSNPRQHIAGRLCVAWLAALCWSGAVCAAEPGQPEVPIVAGVTFVIAVSNTTTPTQPLKHVAQGDYEVVVTITAADDDAIALSAFIDALDAAGTRRQVTIARRQLESDRAGATEQIPGFGTGDPLVLDDSTSLGPSRQVVDALRTTGRSPYAFRNFAGQPKVSGTMARDEVTPTLFPVPINGQRVMLAGMRATGQMAADASVRPYEQIVLADPRQPTSLAEALQRDCHVAVPGIYFDFDQATLKPPPRSSAIWAWTSRGSAAPASVHADPWRPTTRWPAARATGVSSWCAIALAADAPGRRATARGDASTIGTKCPNDHCDLVADGN